MMKELQNFVNNFGLGISKEELATKAYWAMKALGFEVYTINSKYLNVNGQDYEFIKSKKNYCWIVKAF